jgi:hypothetical protein
MNFVGDESLEARLIARLREAGHSILYVHDGRAGMSDEDVLALSTELNAPVANLCTGAGFGPLEWCFFASGRHQHSKRQSNWLRGSRRTTPESTGTM